jgi:hypothetical protein
MVDPQASSTPRHHRVALVIGAVVIVAAGVTAGVVFGTTRTKPHHTAMPTPTPISTAPAAVAPASTPVPSSTAPAVPHEVVAAAAPTAFELKGPGFDIKAHVCGMLNIRPLDPPGEQHHTVCWVREGFGVAPGTTSGTTYVLGHAWGQDSSEVLNPLSEAVMKQVLTIKNPVRLTGIDTWPVTVINGYTLTLTTPKGTLRYTVRDTYAVRKAQAGEVKPLMDESTPNRIVIITCGELRHHDYDYNIIVDAYLTSSIATKV